MQLFVMAGLWTAPEPLAGSSTRPPPIRRMFKLHRAQLARCYNRVVQFRGGPDGTAVVHMTIALDGRVSRVTVDGTLRDGRIRSCIAAEVRRWRFGPMNSIVVVNYPLEFRLTPVPR